MVRHDSRGPLADHLTDTARAALDRSTYGDWRSIATADAVALSFGFPSPDAFPVENLRDSVESVLGEEGGRALQYGGGEYAARLEEFVLEREAARGIDSDDSAVLVTNGATHALDGVCRAFLDPGDVLVVEEPTFMGALGLFRNAGVDLVGVPVDDAGLDVERLAETLATRRERGRPSPTMVYTIPNFQNPTGTTLPRSRRERLLELAVEYDFAVLEDDAYGDLRYDGEAQPPLKAMDDDGRVVRVGTFSKTIAPGVRLGWLIAHESVRDAVRSVTPGGSDTFTRSVVGHYCDAGHLEASLPDLRATYATRRDRMLEGLEERMPAGTAWSDPDGGFFVWVELPAGIDAEAMLSDAVDAGVAYLPGPMFSRDAGGQNRLRLSFSYAAPDEIDDGVEALARTVRARL